MRPLIVKAVRSEEIVAAIETNGGAATYVLYSDEDHGLRRPSNTRIFWRAWKDSSPSISAVDTNR